MWGCHQSQGEHYLLSLAEKIMQENTCQQSPHSGKENHFGAQKMALWSRAHIALIEDPIWFLALILSDSQLPGTPDAGEFDSYGL